MEPGKLAQKVAISANSLDAARNAMYRRLRCEEATTSRGASTDATKTEEAPIPMSIISDDSPRVIEEGFNDSPKPSAQSDEIRQLDQEPEIQDLSDAKKEEQDSHISDDASLKGIDDGKDDTVEAADSKSVERPPTKDRSILIHTFPSVVRALMMARRWLNNQEEEAVVDGTEDKETLAPAQKISVMALDGVFEPEMNLEQTFWKDKIRKLLTFHIQLSDTWYYYWTTFIALLYFYNLLMLIARTAFYELQSKYISMWLALDVFTDLASVVDIFLSTRRCFLDNGILVTDYKELTRHNLKKRWFYLDIASAIPLDFILVVIGHRQPWLRFNRLFRFHRMADFSERTDSRTNFPNAFRILKLMLNIFVIFHWNACFYFMLSSYLGLGVDMWVFGYDKILDVVLCHANASDVPKDNSDEDHLVCGMNDERVVTFSNLTKQYIFSLYWSVTILTTIGEQKAPENNIEYAFVILDILLGLLIFASIVGNVGTMVSNMNASKAEFQDYLDGTKQYMEFRNVTPQLQSRVIKWFHYVWSEGQSLDEEGVLSSLPTKLRAELAIQVHLDTLRRVKLFQDCEPGVLVELVLRLKLQIFSPGDYICKKGDIGTEMYIVKRGSLNVVGDDGKKVFVTLKEGTVLGELSVLNIPGNKTGNRRSASIRSVGYSDLFVLSKDDLWEVLKDYPEARDILLEKGKEILRKDNLLEEDAEEENEALESTDAKLDRLIKQMASLDESLSGLYEEFIETAAHMKQRVTEVERSIDEKKELIKQDMLLGKF